MWTDFSLTGLTASTVRYFALSMKCYLLSTIGVESHIFTACLL